MPDEPWVERVRFGDFSAVPQPLTWARSYDFARLIDGYELAYAAGIVDLGDFAFRARQVAEEAGEWSGTASELWCVLFIEHRAARFARNTFDRDPLLDSLCTSLRFALQIASDEERELLVRFMRAETVRSAAHVARKATWPAAA